MIEEILDKYVELLEEEMRIYKTEAKAIDKEKNIKRNECINKKSKDI